MQIDTNVTDTDEMGEVKVVAIDGVIVYDHSCGSGGIDDAQIEIIANAVDTVITINWIRGEGEFIGVCKLEASTSDMRRLANAMLEACNVADTI